jgi:D-psicose/D-tagatose/L-ribulose 3-epimerase
MQGFGVHTSMWTMQWDREGAERAVKAAVDYDMDFLEIALLDAPSVDTEHTRQLLENHEMKAVCSLGLPEVVWPSRNPEGAIDYLKVVLDTAKAMGTMAVSGVVYGGIGERSGQPPTETELSNVARALEASAKHAKSDNIFIHLDTYHMNLEEKGVANGILDAREHLKYIHLSESDRGTPGEGCCDWDEVFGALAAIGFKGGLAMESFINMPPEIAHGLSVWRPVAPNFQEVMDRGLPFLRNKAAQYRLV